MRLRLLATSLLALGVLAPSGSTSFAATATVPRPDHIVIVIDENHAESDVVGRSAAPYINSLAAKGANFSHSYGVTHPSMPNYLALFSGSTPGTTHEGCPQTWKKPNLATALAAAGLRFVGYSEGVPKSGYTGCGSGQYTREHNPWVDFTNVPAADNQPLTAFPSDYSKLPQVSFVIPNQLHDMHTGTVAQGDKWLQTHLGGYITWAKTHNSVFVLTFDEDDYSAKNRIPTIITGQHVIAGSYSETINHYNILRTIENAYRLAPVGKTATAAPILNIWR
jgi:phosphatidylinositol-3-phosphatase